MTETEETLVYDAMRAIQENAETMAALATADGTAKVREAYKSGVYGPCVTLQVLLGNEALERGKARYEKSAKEAAAHGANGPVRNPIMVRLPIKGVDRSNERSSQVKYRPQTDSGPESARSSGLFGCPFDGKPAQYAVKRRPHSVRPTHEIWCDCLRAMVIEYSFEAAAKSWNGEVSE